MVIEAARVSVTSTATKIAANTHGQTGSEDWGARAVVVNNTTGSAPIFLGGSNAVTTSNGFAWDVDVLGPFEIELEPGEELWGIVASVTQAVQTLVGGR